MFLTNVFDSLKVLADSASQTFDLFASYVDSDQNTRAMVSAGHAKSSLASTTAATLVAYPAKNNFRDVEFITIRARIANSAAATVRIQLYDRSTETSDGAGNGTSYDIFSAYLNPGDTLVYHKARGFMVYANGDRTPTVQSALNDLVREMRIQNNIQSEATSYSGDLATARVNPDLQAT